MIKCKHCKAEIDKVFVVSEYIQVGELSGNTITHLKCGNIEDTLRIECYQCGEDVTKQVNEV